MFTELLVEAHGEQPKKKLLQAILLDPIVDSHNRAVAMLDEFLKLQKDALPPPHDWIWGPGVLSRSPPIVLIASSWCPAISIMQRLLLAGYGSTVDRAEGALMNAPESLLNTARGCDALPMGFGRFRLALGNVGALPVARLAGLVSPRMMSKLRLWRGAILHGIPAITDQRGQGMMVG